MIQEGNPLFLGFLFVRRSLGAAASQLLLISLVRNQQPSFHCQCLPLSQRVGPSDEGVHASSPTTAILRRRRRTLRCREGKGLLMGTVAAG